MRTVVDELVRNAGTGGVLRILGADLHEQDAVPWSEVHHRARRMAFQMAGEHGIGPGCRVGLLGDTSVDLVVAIQAVWLAGAAVTVLAPPAPRHGAENLLAVVADARLDLVVVEDAFASVAPAGTMAARLSTLYGDKESHPARIPDPGELAVLQYTSGSTRSPQGVPVTHGHLAANLDAIWRAADHDAVHPGPMVSWLPLYHDMGLIGFLSLSMACGCSLVLQPPAAFARRPIGWLEAMSRYRATSSGAPNFAYAVMRRLLGTGQELDLSAMRVLISGGEPIDFRHMAEFAELARPYGLDPGALTAGYGLAESTLAVAFSPVGTGIRADPVDPVALEHEGRAVPPRPGQKARELVRLGYPVPGTSLRIRDTTTGEPVLPRTVGAVDVRGPSVVTHYFGQSPDPGREWLATGDLGYLTEAGELVVCGRAKDVLFAAGRNIYPQDIEAVAAAVPGVRAGGVAAFAVPGEHGDRLVVAIESKLPDHDQLRRSVSAAVRDEVGLAPAAVVTLGPGQLPKTTSGKIRRSEIRTRYLAGALIQSYERTTA